MLRSASSNSSMLRRRAGVMWRTGRSDPCRLDPSPEHIGERVDDLAERCVRAHRIDEGRHEVDVGLRGIGAYAGEGGLDARGIALTLYLLQPAALFLFHLGSDAEDRRGRGGVTVEEPVDTHDHVPTGVDLSLELVGGVGDLALIPAFLDAANRAVEHRAVAEFCDPR